MKGLFRQEVLDARSTHWLGSIRIAQPIGDRLAVVMAALVVAAIVAFSVCGAYTRRATVPGLLQPVGGSLRLTTPMPGTVLAVRVVEGQRVAAGDVLFVLSGERLSASGATQAMIGAQLDARQATLARDLKLGAARLESRVRSIRERLASIDVEALRLAQETDVNGARQRIARANVDRFEALAQTGFVSVLQAQARLDEALVLDAQQANLRRVAANLVRERDGLYAQIEESRLQAEGERGEIERTLAGLEQERVESEARRTTVVTAPCDAQVTGLAARPGQGIAAGGLLATLIPDGVPLAAELYATTRLIGFVERGQRVRLRYAAFPYQKFGIAEGVVGAVELSPYAPQELPSQVIATLGPGALQGSEPVYRIVVDIERQSIEVYGKPQPLRPGMVFEADVLQDRRRLVEWLFEPLYGLVGR